MSEVDFHLRNQVQQVQRLIVNLDQNLAAVSTQVALVGQEQQEARNELAGLRADFLAFVRQHELTANIQLAETRIGVLQDQLEHEFGRHNVVRHTAVGMLQAFDVGLVSEETIRSVGEQLMLQTPRYWLAPVLVALAAWSADDPSLCDRAVTEAYRRSPGHTALFMALVLRRQNRLESAARWLRHYLAAQDPNALGRNFAVILEAIAQGAFGPGGVAIVGEFLGRWREQLLVDEAKQDAQVNRWRHEVDAHVAPPAAVPRFPRLAAVSPQWPAMERILAAAESHQAFIDHYRALFAEEIVPADRIEDAIDDILDRLVAEYDDEELPLRRDLALNQAIVRNDGDLERSRRAVAVDAAALETTMDFLEVQTQSALTPDAIGVSRSTQRLAIASCADWISRAHGQFCRDYRGALPPDVTAVFAGDYNVAAKGFKLPPWTGSFQRPLAELEGSLAAHWDQHSRAFIAGFTFDWGKKIIAPIIVTVLALVVLTACIGWVGLILALLVGGVWFVRLHQQSQQVELQRQEVVAFVERAKHDAILQLRGSSAELTDWMSRYQAADRLEPQVMALIADLGRATQASTPYSRRTVTGGVQ
ncbi:hypothetical protein [Dactylosporangium sp. CA-139066]|uniref:hypothetical protein n=1 Tax=Dactylosporangium sp. CA-139066 TaxID=3239930 RepID=UPI003D934CB3